MSISLKIIIGILLISLFLLVSCGKQREEKQTEYKDASLEIINNEDIVTPEQTTPSTYEETTYEETSEELTTNGPDVIFDGYPEPFLEGEIWMHEGQVVMGVVNVTLILPLKNRGNEPTTNVESHEADLLERVTIEQFIITLAAPFTIEPPLEPGESRIITVKTEISDWPEDWGTEIYFFQQIHDTGYADATIIYDSENVQELYLRHDFTVEPRMYNLKYIEKECADDNDCGEGWCNLDFECY